MEFPKYFYFRVKPKRHGTAVVIEDASDADVAEVVRCKDCAYVNARREDMVRCEAHKVWHTLRWYCADGERREDER